MYFRNTESKKKIIITRCIIHYFRINFKCDNKFYFGMDGMLSQMDGGLVAGVLLHTDVTDHPKNEHCHGAIAGNPTNLAEIVAQRRKPSPFLTGWKTHHPLVVFCWFWCGLVEYKPNAAQAARIVVGGWWLGRGRVARRRRP